jgi:hypothetical protein
MCLQEQQRTNQQLVMCIAAGSDSSDKSNVKQPKKKPVPKKREQPTKKEKTENPANITAQIQTYYDRNPGTETAPTSDQPNQQQQNITVEEIEYEDDVVLNSLRKRVYPISIKPVDIYHQSDEFYSHIRDITAGADLTPSGIRACEMIDRDKGSLRSLKGINMNIDDWSKFRDYLRLLLKYHEGDRTQKYVANVKALKLLYGVPGYGESLLLDRFPPTDTANASAIIYGSKQVSKEQRKAAIEDRIRDIERLIIQVATSPMEDENIRRKEQEWLSDLIKYLREQIDVAEPRGKHFIEMDQHHWNSMKELADDLDFFLAPIKQEPLQNTSPPLKFTTTEDHHEDISFPPELRSWKNVLSSNDQYNVNTDIVSDLDNTEATIKKAEPTSENTFQMGSQQMQRLTERDTQWDLLPIPKQKITFNEKFTRLNYIRAQAQLATRYVLADGKRLLLSFIFGSDPPVRGVNGNTRKLTAAILKHRAEFFDLARLRRETATEKLAETLPKFLSLKDLKLDPILHSKKVQDVLGELRAYTTRIYHIIANITGKDIRTVGLTETKHTESKNERSQIDDVTAIDETELTIAELTEYAVGSDPTQKLTQIRAQSEEHARSRLSELGVLLPKNNPSRKIDLVKNGKDDIMRRVNEIIQERKEKRSLREMEKLSVSIESSMIEKTNRGEPPSAEETNALRALKEQIEQEKEKLNKIKDDERISAMDRARMERLGVFDSVVKVSDAGPMRRQVTDSDLANLDDDLILERELRQLDQLLDQMNRDTRRELLSGREQILSNELREDIKEYMRLRNYYAQLVRRDQTLRDWQSLSLRDKLKLEREYFNATGEKYRNVVLGLLRRMQSSQYAESLSYMATALAQQIAKRKANESKSLEEVKSMLLDSLLRERNDLQELNRSYLEKSELLERLSVRRRVATQKASTSSDDKNRILKDKYGYFTTEKEKELSDILDRYDIQRAKDRGKRTVSLESSTQATTDSTLQEFDPQVILYRLENSNLPPQLLDNHNQHSSDQDIDLLTEQLSEDELINLVKEQAAIQQRHRQVRIEEYNRMMKQDVSDQDPAYIVFEMNIRQSMTAQQRYLYQLIFDQEYGNGVTQWQQQSKERIQLTMAPHTLKIAASATTLPSAAKDLYHKLAPKGIDGDEIPDLTLEEWHEMQSGQEKADGLSLQKAYNEPLFPEKPWTDDMFGLQLAYLKLQIERSHDPRYVRNWFIEHGDPAVQSFWQGIWELPEALSNFLQIRPPTIKKKYVPPPPPPPPEKKKQVEAPPPPAQLPVVPPIVPPPPIQPVQPPPPPMAPTLPPIQIPEIPRIQMPTPIPPPQPPPPVFLEPLAPPRRIPPRERAGIMADIMHRRQLLEDIERRLFQS